MATLLAETAFVQKATAEEQAAPPGLLEIRFYTPEPVSEEVEQDIFDKLYYSDIDVKSVHQKKSGGLWYVAVKYRKPAPSESIAALPVAIIPLIAFGFIGTLVGIGIFKIQDIAENLGKLLLIIFGGTALIAVIVRKPAMKAVEAISAKR